MDLMQVNLTVKDSEVTTADGKRLVPDVAYFVPGFWYRVSREGARLIAILVLNGGNDHEVCRLDITENGYYCLKPYDPPPMLRRPAAVLSDTHASIWAVIKLLEELRKSFIHCVIHETGSMMRNTRQPWPPHSRHVTDGKWRRVNRHTGPDVPMTSPDASYIIFVAERGGTIESITIWISIDCTIKELVAALENL